MINVLFLAANPRDTDNLRLGEEIREIKERLRLARLGDRFVVEHESAVRVADLQGHLLRHRPHIVHFSGHGSTAGEILLEDRAGYTQPVSSAALKRLFATLKDNIRCVFLNACYSEVQASGIVESIDCVIGMARAVPDESAIAFASSFYQALGYGRSIKDAFELGCCEIDLQDSRIAGPRRDLGPSESQRRADDLPKLKVATGVDPSVIYLANAASGHSLTGFNGSAHPLLSSVGPTGTATIRPGVLWDVPFPRNPFYTGRDEILAKIRSALEPERRGAQSGQIQGVTGLGGIGKTQTAVEYAYRHQRDYGVVL